MIMDVPTLAHLMVSDDEVLYECWSLSFLF